MRKNKQTILAVGAALSCAGAFAMGVYVHRASAEGIPSPTALYYAGVLEEAGVPVDGARDIEVAIYASLGTLTPACTATAPGTTVSGGHFRVPLPDACTDAIHTNPNAYVEVSVGGDVMGRLPIGAVPYAVEADHSVTASDADRATSLVLSNGPLQLTVGTYVGETAPTTGAHTSASLTGYPASRALCDAAHPGSHMCTGQELILSAQLEIAIPSGGWFATDYGHYDSAASSSGDSPWDFSCGGFTSAVLDGNGPIWTTSPDSSRCNVAHPILCCR